MRHNLAVPPRTHAEVVLELDRVLALAAANCSTPLGAEFLIATSPIYGRDVVERRVSQTSEALELLRDSEPPIYSNARDVKAAVGSAGKGSTIPGEEIFRVGETLDAMMRLRKYLVGRREDTPELARISEQLPYLPELQAELHASVSPEGEVLDSASSVLAKIRGEKSAQARRIATRIQNLINGSLKTYLQEPIYTIRDGRYVVPVKAQYKGKVPGIVHDASGSGQTIFVEPESVVSDSNKLREIESMEREEVERILRSLSKKIGDQCDSILCGIESLSELDSIFGKARFALDTDSVAPKFIDGNRIRIESGHHPLIDREQSIPIDVAIGGSYGSMLITGPNTGGKTVTLKLIGLYALMIGCGFLLPASSVSYGPFGNVWADIGDEQSLQQSLSTFSGHLRNIATIFEKAKAGDLVLLDEIGAGTDPREGAALGQSILNSLANRGVVIAASTHYGELKAYAQSDARFHCAAMEFDVASLKPTYRLIAGASGQSHALEISRRHGLPESVVDDAEAILGSEAADERVKSGELDRLLQEARQQRDEAVKLRHEAEGLMKKAELDREEQLEKLRRARARAEEIANEALREARQRYRELLEATRAAQPAEKEAILQEARKIEDDLRAAKSEISPEIVAQQAPSVVAGMAVRLISNNQVGQVLEIQKSGKVIVQVGALKISLKPNELVPLEDSRKESRRRHVSTSVHKTMHASSELHLRHMRAEDAIESLEKFFDDAVLAGLHRVRIVHGKGSGVLRKIVREFVANRSDVLSVRDGDPGEGGTGVTVVNFK